MKIYKEKFKKNDQGHFYWGRIYFVSDNRQYKTKIIWAMSFEWTRRQLQEETWQEEEVGKLVNKIIVAKWKNVGRAVFSHKTQYDPWAINEQETAALKEFIIERSRADSGGR